MSLEEIIEGCKRNSLVHQKALYNCYEKSLFHLSLKYCTNIEEAEDNLHDAFLVIFEQIKNFSNKGSFEGWVKRITINMAIAKFKSTINQKPLDHFTFSVIEEDIQIDTDELSIDFLLALIQELPNQYRLVFNLYELDDYSHKEIAEMLSISEGTSKSNLHKAKIILKKRMLESQPIKRKNGI